MAGMLIRACIAATRFRDVFYPLSSAVNTDSEREAR